jgi:hypothetical protein
MPASGPNIQRRCSAKEPNSGTSDWPQGGEDREFADSPLEQSGFEPLVPLATEMLIELPRGITDSDGHHIGPAHRSRLESHPLS